MSLGPNEPLKPSCSSNSITELLGALCDCSLSGLSWKRRAMGGVSREAFRRVLKKRAYGALLSKLFQDGTKGSVSGPSATAKTPPRNKVLMISFDLRVAGCQEEAERLEEHLGRLPEGVSSGLLEIDSVLELLVQLAGSALPPPTSFSRDYMRRERPVLRRPQPWGYQSKELQRLEARAWGLVCREEWGSLDNLCGIQRLMDAPPGTGLLALRSNLDVEEKFEKETRLSLFGALQHTRTSELDVRLDLPPVPSNVDVTGLAIRVPSFLDQSEDEGFQSASNLTPDSQSEPSPTPEVDIWEALRTFEPGRRRCWESVGCPPGKRESLYLTEGGRQAFDQLYRLWEGELRVVCTSTPSPLFPLPLDSQTQLVMDLLNVLIGVASTTFSLNQNLQFDVRPSVCVSGASPESVSRLLGELAQYGTYYLRLSHFSLQSARKKGLVFQAFTGGLRKYLHYYRACVLSTPPNLSLLTVGFLFRKVGRQLRYLSELCCVDGSLGAGQATFPVGVQLLSYLYNEAQNNCSNENYPVLLSLLKSSCEPYTRFVSDWVYNGVFQDVYGEFMIQVNEEYLDYRDKHFWVQGYTLISKDAEDCVPLFLRHIANDVYVCGKTINLLRICSPQHYICWSELPVPRIAVTFSLREVEEIEKDCAVYRGRMEMIAKYSAISREAQALRAEQVRLELINHVRESAAKTLEHIRGRQVSQHLAEEAKKRERFKELKQHLEQEWRNAAKKKEEEDDFSFARELRDREKRLQALEEQLEQRARKELIAQYSCLSEEAARRERRALWKVQRMTLNKARAQFLTQDWQDTQAILKKYPLGQAKPPLPSGATALQETQESETLHTSEQKSEKTEESTTVSKSQGSCSLPPSQCRGDSVLISENIDICDFIPKSFKSLQVDKALQEIGSDLPETLESNLVDYDFSAPFTSLHGITGQASDQTRPDGDLASKPDITQSHPFVSCGSVVKNIPQVQEPLPKAKLFGQASKPSTALGHHELQASKKTSKANVCGYPSQSSEQLVDESSLIMPSKQEVASVPKHTISVTEMKLEAKDNDDELTEHTKGLDVLDQLTSLPSVFPLTMPVQGTDDVDHNVLTELSHCGDVQPLTLNTDEDGYISEVTSAVPVPNIPGHDFTVHLNIQELVPDVSSQTVSRDHGHSSDTYISGDCLSKVTATEPSPNIHGHASDAHIKIGEYVSEVINLLPSATGHGHCSDAHIKVGENIAEFVAPFPSPNIHGHSSDAHIKVGEHVSDVFDPQPSRNVHGHASDAHIKVGEHVSEVVAPLSTPSIHGHSSDANIKVGDFVSNIPDARPRWSKHGHASDCILKSGCVVSGTETSLLPLPGSMYGHSSDSTLGIGCVVLGDEPQHSPLPGSGYGHASDSNLAVGCVVSKAEPLPSPLPGSTYGHSSDSSLGVGCLVLGLEDPPSALPVSAYGHSSDSSLGVGCVVQCKGSEGRQRTDDNNDDEGPKVNIGEQHVEGMGSWEPNLNISPGDSSEQEYLSTLASHYQVEHYEDCYNIMASSPECQLLKHVTRGTWGLPVDPSLRKATDTTAVQLSEMVSLPILIKHSVTTPLITHVSLVNKAVVDYFFVELRLERHFETLRHFLLMEDGEFAQSLSDLLFEKLSSGQTPGELLTPLVLNSILSKALQYSLHGDTPSAANFTFALRFLPEMFHPLAPDSLNCLELRYKVDWPLNIIITDSCMNKYNRLFSFLLQLKHMVWSLCDVWFHLRRTALVKGAGRSVQFRQLQLYRHEMQHFVKVIQGYISNQILQVSWSEFTAKLAAANDLDAIHRTHADYLNRAIFRALLTDKAAPVMNIIHSIFSLILKFRAQLIAQPWDSQQGEAVHPSFIAMQQSYNTFKYYSHFLFKVVTKLVNRGYQPHLEDFLLRINFNNYYKDS
ncbi:gamma-tubulin complex component 6 isoform X2 [Thalassophryne amazonica]|uniref:gamma-tubulin complex component 6 isoform X2 n=1 Tax=Thalassophryne amazonica TaxID=390379 RepID=UPI0014726455|nr:gamma-tubulin complex component 6 isoform X2 [Thalassophryne amazonica]